MPILRVFGITMITFGIMILIWPDLLAVLIAIILITFGLSLFGMGQISNNNWWFSFNSGRWWKKDKKKTVFEYVED